MSVIKIEDALKKYDKRYYRLGLNEDTMEAFKKNVDLYIKSTKIAIEQKESEEHLKKLTNDFLKNCFYIDASYDINTTGRIDSTISKDGEVRVIIENKNPTNKGEMVSAENINVKALHEILSYYMILTRNTLGNKVSRIPDVEIRRAVITDNLSWVIIDINDIEKIVDGYLEKLFYKYKNNQLVYSNNNDKFYEDIKTYLDTINISEKLNYIYFNITDYTSPDNIQKLYKVLHKNYLLKEKFNSDTSAHVLNEKFYQELLYIMGLKEKSGKTSKTIEIDSTIRNSLANQIFKVLKHDKEYDEISCIEKTFELSIIWVNRLLFIKLFEGQLISFNGDDSRYHILDNEKITSFQDLQDLFFEVLGRKNREDTEFINRFSDVPYLNSSLFERYEIEKSELNINAIHNESVTVKRNSVINSNDSNIKLLEYIISFLNSYNFSSQMGKNNTLVQGKDIIDASVLGLIFEKLNGYRDGSFYTPSVITEFMCRQSVEYSVIDAINRKKHWNCKNIYDVRNRLTRSLEEAREINEIINSVKICDISVGSGHFLVSALNQMICIKKQLGVLFKHGKDELLTEYDIDVVDDVLQVFNGQGKPFYYDKDSVLSQQVQETLFNEKRRIIENCIFGVDSNPKAVAICQLRLWIELLKNAYYKNGVMETLPNIDINIKTGNSLINKLNFSIGKKLTVSKAEYSKETVNLIKQYKSLVFSYKETSDKVKKNEIKQKISQLKFNLRSLAFQMELKTDKNNVLTLNQGMSNSVYADAFEWAIEFPELLSEEGIFNGFDCIIGNPPYGLLNKKQNQNTSISVSADVLEFYKNADNYKWARGGVLNIYRLFICRCFELLRPNGYCCLIFPLAFMCDSTNLKIRQYIMENTSISFLEAFPERDIESKRVFPEVKMSVCILGAIKQKCQDDYKFGVRLHKNNYVDEANEIMGISYKDVKTIDEEYISIPMIRQHELPIFLKMTDNCKRMSYYSKCYTGEVDISLHRDFITTDENDALMLRGAQVQKYYITNDISQGDILYLKHKEYLNKNTGEKAGHHNRRRIVMQGITGINEKWRLKMTLANPPYFCANSVNYLIPNPDNDFDLFILGLLNSTLLNWYFSKLSTNSNVNGYEIDGLPIKIGNKDYVDNIISLVKENLNNPSDDINKKIDKIVYNIYGIDTNDIPIIEG